MSPQHGSFPPPSPFLIETDVGETAWIDEHLQPLGRLERGVLVGELVPSGFEAYARVFHPAKRLQGPSAEESTALRWAEIAAVRDKVVHPEMQIEALVDRAYEFDYDHWRAISVGDGEWFPPYEWLEETEGLALLAALRSYTQTPEDGWFLLWDGYGDLGEGIGEVPRGMIHPAPPGTRLPPELEGTTLAFRHYLVFRAPLDALEAWYRWRSEGPNYWWPGDRSWVVASEIDGFSTYVGASASCIEAILASPFLEALPSGLDRRFDVWGDTINGPPPR